MRRLYFITTNKGKFEEVRELLEGCIELIQKSIELEEPRGTIEEIALSKAKKAYEIIKAPLIVEDTGFFIPSLNGFPGEFSKWVVNKIGVEGIIKLMEGKKGEERRAFFKTIVCFFDGKGKLFEGRVEGHISLKPRGNPKKSLPYDSIFIPKGFSSTFAEDEGLKNRISHRAIAIKKLKEWYCKD